MRHPNRLRDCPPAPALALTLALLAGMACASNAAVATTEPAPDPGSQSEAEPTPDPADEPAAEDGASRAARFARAFMDGDDATVTPMLDATMAAQFGPEALARTRAQITAALGAVERWGEPWLEMVKDGLERYRVPTWFRNGPADLAVVLHAADGKVAGFFVKPQELKPEDADAPTGPGRAVEIEFGDPETPLPGTLQVPEGEGPFPAVVLVHGSGAQDRDERLGERRPFRDLAWGLAERGIASLRYDKRTKVYAGRMGIPAEELTVQEETVLDAVDAVAWLRAREEIDADRVFVVGHSLGGMVAPRIVTRIEPRPAGAVLLAALARRLPETVLRQVEYLASVDGEVSEAERVELETLRRQVAAMRRALDGAEIDPQPRPEPVLGMMPLAYLRDLESQDPVSAAAALDIPLLVLQGGRDVNVTVEDFELWKKALAERPGNCFGLYPTLDHLFIAGEGPVTPATAMEAGEVAAPVIADIARFVLEGACPE